MSPLTTADVGERLRITREVFDRRQGAIARAVGISASQLTQYETGYRRPSPRRAAEILQAIVFADNLPDPARCQRRPAHA
jgi:transcriptional regulator with XRE-family HTH domain